MKRSVTALGAAVLALALTGGPAAAAPPDDGGGGGVSDGGGLSNGAVLRPASLETGAAEALPMTGLMVAQLLAIGLALMAAGRIVMGASKRDGRALA
jgi:hypothetical protein